MKLFIKVLLFIVVIACAAPFILKDKHGLAWMSFDQLVFPDLGFPDVSPVLDAGRDAGVLPEGEVKTTTVYKWRDDQGVWHFSDDAIAGVQSEVLTVDNNTNIVHLDVPEVPVEEENTSDKESSKNEQALAPDDSPYEQLPELMDKARNVENLLNARHEEQQRILNDLGGL